MVMEMSPESVQQDQTLAAIGQRIYGSFDLLEEAARSHKYEDTFSSALVNQFQRFGLWAKSLGLYNLGHSSLDYRFRDAPTVHEYTRKLLDDLEKSIYQIQQEVDRLGSDWADVAERPNCHENPSNQVAVVDTEFDMDQGSDTSSEDEETLMTYQGESISSIVLENIRLIIDRLYKLAFQIRNPATRMGLSKARDYREIDQETGVDIMDCYAFFDLRHLVEKAARYGDKSREECENNYLIQRLARANTDRRRQFAYWRRHKLKLDKAEKAVARNSGNKANAQVRVTPTLSNSHQGSEKNTVSQPSTATRLDESNVNLNDTSSACTSSSHGTLFKEDDEENIKIPPLPEKYCSGDAFECPYCYVLCSRRVSKNMAWERHVIKDLRPYICTYQNCPEGDLQYDNIKDWVSHEIRAHRDTKLQGADISEQYPEDHRQSQPSNSITSNDTSRQECPLCFVQNPTFVHIGRHLRDAAIFALPNSMGPDDDNTLEDQGSNIANLDNQDSMSDRSEFEYREEGARRSNDIVHVEETQRENIRHLTLAFQQLGKTNTSGPDIDAYITGLEPDVTLLHPDKAANTRPMPNPLTIATAGISFYVRIDPLFPDYQAQPARHGSHGLWAPPDIKTGYTRRLRYSFRWMNGNMTIVKPNDPVGRTLSQNHSTATVFTQNPDTPHLLVVPFDATRTNVIENPGGWRPLVFHHLPVDNTRTYSAVSANGDRQRIAAPGLAHWMPQLLPPVYNYRSGPVRIQAGLIGSLPLLIALAAFSAPPNVLVGVLTKCIQPVEWLPHQFQYPAGHIPERGMVVTVFFDPTNPQGSNAALLNRLQAGEFGPFYN